MGGALLSVMSVMSTRSLAPQPSIEDYRKRAASGFLREVPDTGTAATSPIYRFREADEAAYAKTAAAYHGSTFLDILRRMVEERRGTDVLAYRPVNRVVKETVVDPATGKAREVDVTYFDATVTLTYGEVWERIESFGRGLAKLGIAPKSNIAIYQETCLEWFVAIYAIWSQGMTAATVYANLGEAALAHALRETEAAAVVCGLSNAHHVVQMVREGVVPPTVILTVGSVPGSEGLSVFTFDEVLAMGREAAAADVMAGAPSTDGDDLALIMYTSGTTGDPKGVMHSHGSLAAGMASCFSRITDLTGPIRPGDQYCAYLPMAHIMEFTVVNILICRGCFIGFGSPRTLTDATARPHGDLTEFKPMFIAGVPRVFDTIKKAIEAKLPEPGTLKRRIFDHAYESRLKALKEGYETPYWNEKVFASTRALLGGRVRGLLVGGGPMSASLQEFVNVALGLCAPGYGLTETVCVGNVGILGDLEPECCGILMPGEEMKLMDTEHYKHTDKPEPRGELLQRGRYLFKGYYKQPELTKAVMDEDGWFHTGDIGSITKEGKVRIIGRVKAIAKNSLGEYIAMEALEAIYSSNPLLQPNGVCVLVHPNRNYICAVALTDEAKAMAFAKKEGIEGEWPAILEKPEFQAAAARSLVETARDAKRMPFEFVRHVRVLNDEWTVENDVLTAAQKLKRRVIDERYADIIAELFKEE